MNITAMDWLYNKEIMLEYYKSLENFGLERFGF